MNYSEIGRKLRIAGQSREISFIENWAYIGTKAGNAQRLICMEHAASSLGFTPEEGDEICEEMIALKVNGCIACYDEKSE